MRNAPAPSSISWAALAREQQCPVARHSATVTAASAPAAHFISPQSFAGEKIEVACFPWRGTSGLNRMIFSFGMRRGR